MDIQFLEGTMRIRTGSLIVLAVGIVCLPAFADTVHHYTNVTTIDGHYLVTEGTKGATMLNYTGSNSLGLGGSTAAPYDDTWRWSTTTVEHADYFDRYWRQIIGTANHITYDLGGLYTKLYVALSQDHGPYPEEALEYRVWVSNDNSTYTQLGATTAITVYKKGWSTAGEYAGDANGNGVLNDDYSAMWALGGAYRYVRLTPILDSGGYNEPEIDAVMGVNLVPLPSAAWAGLGLLGLLAVRRYSRRRRV
jgi:hypothetical protein